MLATMDAPGLVEGRFGLRVPEVQPLTGTPVEQALDFFRMLAVANGLADIPPDGSFAEFSYDRSIIKRRQEQLGLLGGAHFVMDMSIDERGPEQASHPSVAGTIPVIGVEHHKVRLAPRVQGKPQRLYSVDFRPVATLDSSGEVKIGRRIKFRAEDGSTVTDQDNPHDQFEVLRDELHVLRRDLITRPRPFYRRTRT